MKKSAILIVVLVALTLASCTTTKPLYSWHNSEDAAYQYTKKLTEKELTEAMAQYKLVIEQQKGTRATVPPGANAEYGYMLVKAGRKQEGIALLKAEMQLYPESKTFVSRIVNQLEK